MVKVRTFLLGRFITGLIQTSSFTQKINLEAAFHLGKVILNLIKEIEITVKTVTQMFCCLLQIRHMKAAILQEAVKAAGALSFQILGGKHLKMNGQMQE